MMIHIHNHTKMMIHKIHTGHTNDTKKKCLTCLDQDISLYKKNTQTKGQAPETLAEQSEPVSKARPIAKPK